MRPGNRHLHIEPATPKSDTAESLMLALMSQDAGFAPWETSAPQLPSNHPSEATTLVVVPLRAVG